MATLGVEATGWRDTEGYALAIRDRFDAQVNADPALKAHRDFVEKHVYGFGERAFHWLWKILVDEMPASFSFLEVGVYKGQVPSVIRLLADRTEREAVIVGVTLLSPFSGISGRFDRFPDEDYDQHIRDLHDHFNQVYPTLVIGDSGAETVQKDAELAGAPYDIVFVDGCHEYDYVLRDLRFYPVLLKPGGFLVVDDCATDLKQPWGFYQGIPEVTEAVRTVIETDPQWKHLLTVVHDRVWKRGE